LNNVCRIFIAILFDELLDYHNYFGLMALLLQNFVK